MPAAGSLLPLSLLFAKTFRCAEGAGGQDPGLASSQRSQRTSGLTATAISVEVDLPGGSNRKANRLVGSTSAWCGAGRKSRPDVCP